MNQIAITTDSACDMSKEMLNENQIEVLPLHVIFGTKEYADGVDVTSKDVLKFIDETGTLPKTSACSVEEYRSFFARKSVGYDRVIYVSISSGLSCTVQNAMIAAEEFGGKVIVIDSKQLSSGQALLVLKACRLRDEGRTAEEIATLLLQVRERIRLSCVVNKLDNLCKGGRCTAVASFASKLLRIHPVIETRDGSMAVSKKYLGTLKHCINQYLDDLAGQVRVCDDIGAFIVHADCDSGIIEAAKRKLEEKFHFPKLYVAEAGSAVSTHCGQGAFCVVYLEKQEQ